MSFEDLFERISYLRTQAAQQLLEHEKEIGRMVTSGSLDQGAIERKLDSLLDLIHLGMGDLAIRRLIKYYSTLNPQAAKFYKREYLRLKND